MAPAGFARAGGRPPSARNAEADVQYKAALAFDPGNSATHIRRATVLMALSRLGEALAEAQAAVETGPRSPQALATLARVWLLRGDLQAALAAYDRAIASGRDPVQVAETLNDSAAPLARRGQLKDAELLVRKAALLNPALIEARHNLVLILADEGRAEEARSALQQAIAQTGTTRGFEDVIARLAPAKASPIPRPQPDPRAVP